MYITALRACGHLHLMSTNRSHVLYKGGMLIFESEKLPYLLYLLQNEDSPVGTQCMIPIITP